jgi:SAM-dependent methyltransferase
VKKAPQSSAPRACWCGHGKLDAFSPHYRICRKCGTLVSTFRHSGDVSHVQNDDRDLYGREYWFSHMEKDLGFGNFYERARADLAERCQYWLKTLLKYATPPKRVLELGSAHGGFVALMRWAGYDATGLELSPAIVTLAREIFGVPMLEGPIEDQQIDAGSLDVIVLMDVLEHLPDPVQTMRECLRLLKPDGFLLIQTPMYPLGKSLQDLETEGHRFVEMLKEQEHLYLFSERSVTQLFAQLGADHLTFEPALFGHYDMFLTVSRVPLAETTPADREARMAQAPAGRLAQAGLDLFAQVQQLQQALAESDADRGARGEMIEFLQARLKDVDADRANRLEGIERLEKQLIEAETDRANRLAAVQELGARLAQSEADRHARLQANDELTALLKESEADRHARLQAMEELTRLLKQSEADRAARLQVINELSARLKEAEAKASA